MQYIKSRRQAIYVAFGLALTALLIYHRWFNFSIFSYGDWYYRFIPTLKEQIYPSLWLGSIGFGSFNELAWRVPYDILLSLFSLFGYGLNVSEKFIILWPLAILSTVAPYVLLRQFTQRRWVAFVGALFYATNTYYLTIDSQGHQLLVLGFNYLTLALGLLLIGLRTRKLVYLLGVAILLFFAGAADFRVLYIGGFMLVAFILFFWPRNLKKAEKTVLLRHVAIFFVLLFGIELYSLVSVGLSLVSPASGSILGRSLFGSQFWDLTSAISLQHPFWTGSDTSWFQVNAVKPYYWLIPLMAFAAVALRWRDDKRVLFFAGMAIIGIALSKQISQPLGSLYPFLFEHFPGFNAFREATKFYYLILIGYMVLIALLLEYICDATRKKERKKLRRLQYGLVGALVVICFFNALPYITGSIEKITAPRTIPVDYAKLEQQLSRGKQDTYFRTLWVPAPSRWSYYDNQHPRISALNLLSAKATLSKDTVDVPSQRQILDLIDSNLFESYLKSSSVKYVIVPIRDIENQNDFFSFYGDSRQPYLDELARQPFLTRVSDYKDLAVFENKQYNSYIHTPSSVFSISDGSNVEDTKLFLDTLMGGDTDYIVDSQKNSSQKKVPSQTIEDAFSNMNYDEAVKGAMKRSIPAGSDVYVDTSTGSYSYVIANGVLSVYKKNLTQNSTTKIIRLAETQPELVQQVNIATGTDYSIEANNRLYAVDLEVTERELGYIQGPIRIIAAKNKNLVENNSFENGLWEKNVTDCDDYDDDPKISMWQDAKDPTDGEKSLSLSARRHTACTTSAPIPVTPGKNYVLTFDYRAPYSDQIAYRVIPVGVSSGTAPEMRHIEKKVNEWRTLSDVVEVPEGASAVKIELRGLPPGLFSSTGRTTSYDNIKLVEADVFALQTPATTNYEKVTTSSDSTLEYATARSSGNLIINGSLENGLWQKDVGDCNDYDNNPKISMQLTNGVASNGNKAVELSALRHIACTGPSPIPVTEGSVYLFSFDHSSPNNNDGHYYISFNDTAKSSISVDFDSTKKWQTYQKAISVPIGATMMDIKLHAKPAKASKGINRYDNLRLIRVPDLMNRAYVITDEVGATDGAKASTTYIDTSQRKVKVSSKNSAVYLSMGETYNPAWVLKSAKSGRVLTAGVVRFKINNQFNGWYLNMDEVCKQPSLCETTPDGERQVELVASFSAQRFFNIAFIISGVTLIGSIVGFIVLALKRRPPPKSKGRKSGD